MKLYLVKPDIKYEKFFIDMAEDYRHAKEDRYQHNLSWNHDRFVEYIIQLKNQSKNINLKTGYVPSSTFWLLLDNKKIVGVSRFRHYLTENLKKEGGHIGYDVPPSCRNKGYGTKLLSLTLQKSKYFGINEVLITCDEDNTASRSVIENNFGELISTGISERTEKSILRYMIHVQNRIDK